MKKIHLFSLSLFLLYAAQAQFCVKYDPSKQPVNNLQYFKPVGNNLFVGDAIPFFHNNTYYLFWLLDSAHHSSLGGLGGHQWVVSTTKDLKKWVHYPISIGIDEDWEKSICTGSIAYDNKNFYAFYATRLINKEGKVNEQLSYAISKDGIHYKKQKPNPFYTSAPGYSAKDFRDPKVIIDSTGTFHLFVSSKKNNAPIQGLDGALVHLTSKDLKEWNLNDPILTGQPSVPECPDYFSWNGWYYLVYSHHGNTFYVKSRSPYGPWQQPRNQTLNEDWANVVKTAEFTNGRRIAAAWIPSRKENKDSEREIFGGNAIFREVIQEGDGTLATKFPPEMIPETGQPVALKLIPDASVTTSDAHSYLISSPNGVGSAHFENIPQNCRITLEIEPLSNNEEYGLYLRSAEKAAGGYKLNFLQNERIVTLGNTSIYAVEGLDKNIKVDIIMKDDIIDVSVDNRRCISNRLSEQKGSFLWFYAKHGNVRFKSIKVYPIKEQNK
jgi:hypothetical protein